MVGICGTTIEKNDEILKNGLRYIGNELVLSKEIAPIYVNLVKHSESRSSYANKESKHCWIHGDVKGFYKNGNYKRVKNKKTAEFLIDHPQKKLDKLNGEFFGVIFDESQKLLKLITDRLGTRATYYKKKDDQISFSNDIQSLYECSDNELSKDYCIEYLAFNRVFGTKTPYKKIKKLPPASITSIDLETGEFSQKCYWIPKYEPKNKPYPYFVNKFVDIFKQILKEKIKENKSYGLMLSGGSDSRLIASAINKRIKCYHANEFFNLETRIAKKIADETNNEFIFLKRDENYQSRALKDNIKLFKFVSHFNQAHLYGFRDKLIKENDFLIHGFLGDTFFKGHFIDPISLNLGPIGNLNLPFAKKINNMTEYIHEYDEDPIYLKNSKKPKKIISEEISKTKRGITHHGVLYNSIEELNLCSQYYPLTNQSDYLFYDHSLQMKPTITPFLDMRLIDLHLKMPKKYFFRKNIINSAIKKIKPKLANIIYPSSKLPLKYPESIHFLSSQVIGKIQDIWPKKNKKPHHSKGPWTDHKELLRNKDFALQSLKRNKDKINRLPFIDEEKIETMYKRHQQGENHRDKIYSLITFLESNI